VASPPVEHRAVPYRVLVVRPVDRARFNGIGHVNWQNVTAVLRIGIADAESEQLLDGFAWVGVSAQRVGVHGFPGSEQFAQIQNDLCAGHALDSVAP
jgi:hypothetical protein